MASVEVIVNICLGTGLDLEGSYKRVWLGAMVKEVMWWRWRLVMEAAERERGWSGWRESESLPEESLFWRWRD